METLERWAPAEGARTAAPAQALVPVVLSGGSGTRLWPISRDSLPKQFWPLMTEQTMLQDAVLRVAGDGFAPPIVVCNKEHRFLVAEQLRAAGIQPAKLCLEPAGRNSAPALAAAALTAMETDPQAVLCMLPADAAIGDVAALRAAVSIAAVAARAGRIAMIGITPSKPAIGYGYIGRGEAFGPAPGAFEISRFVEKPDRDFAEELIASGGYLWNSGMFVLSAATLLAELEQFEPELLRQVTQAVSTARADGAFLWLGEAFTDCPAISLDYAVAERTSRGVVVPAEFDWSDVGSWDALWEFAAKDADGNAAQGDVLLEAAQDCYVRSEGPLTAVLGVKDIVVVTAPDAVLVLHKDHAQQVKTVVDRLRWAGRSEAAVHRRILRPWGYYESILSGSRYQVKRICVGPGAELSLQKHFHRAEHWVVVEGSGLVTCGDREFLVSENESAFVPLGCVHKIKNPGRIPLMFIEVQSGAYLGEDDIVRLADSYGRA